MYARSVVLAFTIIVSTGLDRLVCSHKDVQFIKNGVPFWREKSSKDNTLNRDIHKVIERFRKDLEWNAREDFSKHAETLEKSQGNVFGRNLRFDLNHHHHHRFHHNKLGNELGQEEKLNSGRTRKEDKELKFKDSGEVVKKDRVKLSGRKRYRKKPKRITGMFERRDKLKNGNGKFVQEIFPRYQTDKRFMVISGPGKNVSVKRKRFHFSHELVNALKLVLDKRNSFKKDANILDLAKALQSRDQESNMYRNNSITTGVSRGLTQNGQRVRVVRVKDPGYNDSRLNDNHRNRLRLQNPVYRSKILQDARRSHSVLVNPTELGTSILKLLFGKKARFVTKPKYRHLVGAARPNMKYLEGYGSKDQRAELEKEIEKENQMILLRGVKKHELEKSLAKSISDLIKAMDRKKVGSEEKERKVELKSSKHDAETSMAKAVGNSERKNSSTQDRIGTRKSWVLLKMPKGNEEVEQDKVTHYHEAEREDYNPAKASVHQIATLGKKNNELSDIKVVHQRKPHVENSYDDIASDDESQPGRLKSASGLAKYTHTDTESRTVPQISYNLNSIKSNRNSLKNSGGDSNGLASTLGKILKGIQESVKELKEQHKEKEASPESSAVTKMTSPASKTSHESSVAKIHDLLVAVNKLLGGDARSSQMPSHSEITGIPSDQASVQNVPTVDDNDAAAARRYVDGVRASTNPLQLRPSTGYFDEPITTSVTSRKGVGEDKSLDNVLFESDELGTQRDRQATADAIRLKEDLESFAEKGLNAHNNYRELHHAQKLKWSDDLATQAEKMAYDMAMKGTIEKSAVASALGYGENVAKITGTTFNKAGEEATNLWYAEIANYSFSDPRLSPETDSFAQVVWKSTTKLGMGCARDLQTNDLYVVALYDPKGNDPVGLRSNVINKGGVTEDVYASIFKRHRLEGKTTTRSKIGKL